MLRSRGVRFLRAMFVSALGCASGVPLQAAAARPKRFADYVAKYGREYAPGSAESLLRMTLFQQRVQEVDRHNDRADRLWTAGINHLTDRTDEELAELRGYRPHARPRTKPFAGNFLKRSVDFLGRGPGNAVDLDELPTNFTWQGHLNATAHVQDQSTCGSCWAFASGTVLRAHSELYQVDRTFSVQQIVSCTPNPQQCGGDGGCKGATADLAMDYVVHNGCKTHGEWGYDATDDPRLCPVAPSFTEVSRGSLEGGLALGLRGSQRLPENRLAPVMLALYTQGPVAVALAAGRTWNMYHSGVMDTCLPDAVIDHAVTLVGFGVAYNVGRADRTSNAGQKFWQIQNSWGPVWGEGGFIRLARKDHKDEERYCGTDHRPEIGSGCKGGPPSVTVCGSCGILYDAVVPDFALAPGGLWASSRFPLSRRKVPEANHAQASAELQQARAHKTS